MIAGRGATPLAISRDGRALGVIELKDTVKPGLTERFAEFRRMGVRTVMITGDNPLTAATIAAEAGVDDFVAEAKPEDKIAFIRAEQAEGHLVAMTGDGTNDAPALAQADVGLAMNSGTSASKEAANMVDLDSDPTKLLEVIAIGKQLLITRGSITTFSIANDVAKYFAILPALFVGVYPELAALNVMGLATPQSAILSAVIFNALVIVALIPLALRGVAFRAAPAAILLRRNLLVYGLGGLIAPFVGIKLIDVAITVVRPRLRSFAMTSFLATHLRPALVVLLALTFVTGIAYPAAVTAVAQVVFPAQANGSLIVVDGRAVGSTLIGQAFDDPRYFWGRPSNAGDGYDGMASGGSNLGPDEQHPDRAGHGRCGPPSRRERRCADPRGPGHSPRRPGSTRTSARRRPRTRWRGWRRLAGSRRRMSRRRSRDTPRAGSWAFLGQPRVNVLALNLDLDGLMR